MVNATGWSQLMAGDLIGASWIMYDTALATWTISILFFVFQFMLWRKTGNATLMFIMGLFFVSLYAGLETFSSVVNINSVWVMFVLLAVELGFIIFMWIWK